jgi:medium-chain acyl-[acyl-carrier-protein] hydrolase
VLLADVEMRALFLPILRADLAMLGKYDGTKHGPLTASLRCFAGIDDRSVSSVGLEAWGDVAGGDFSVQRFPGGHFYHFGEGQRELLAALGKALGSGQG